MSLIYMFIPDKPVIFLSPFSSCLHLPLQFTLPAGLPPSLPPRPPPVSTRADGARGWGLREVCSETVFITVRHSSSLQGPVLTPVICIHVPYSGMALNLSPWLVQSFSIFTLQQNHLEALLKQITRNHFPVWIQEGLVNRRGEKNAFLVNSQVALMLLVWGWHLEDYRIRKCVQSWPFPSPSNSISLTKMRVRKEIQDHKLSLSLPQDGPFREARNNSSHEGSNLKSGLSSLPTTHDKIKTLSREGAPEMEVRK